MLDGAEIVTIEGLAKEEELHPCKPPSSSMTAFNAAIRSGLCFRLLSRPEKMASLA
jgi:aerobic-type carbon monoxide dehydrogenase small subunit (CoxS/CutS family)